MDSSPLNSHENQTSSDQIATSSFIKRNRRQVCFSSNASSACQLSSNDFTCDSYNENDFLDDDDSTTKVPVRDQLLH